MKLIISNLVNELKVQSNEAVQISWNTAFAITSGVKLMLDTLKDVHHGAEMQLLVGNYLSITHQVLVAHQIYRNRL